MERMSAFTDEMRYDAALDHLVDAGNYSYDEAHSILGEPPYEIYEVATANDQADQRSESPDVDSIHQIEINQRGMALVRAALMAAR